MTKKDILYDESRIIRKATKEGKTIVDIMDMLSLSEKQIIYRIETRYSERIAKSILKKLKENVTIEPKSTKKSKKVSEKSLVVDTSALGKRGAFEFIMSHSSIILIFDVVVELEQRKKEKSLLGMNIRNLLHESAKDQEGKKIKVVLAKKVSNYTDDNLLNFCKGKNVILYTADNGMATKAKAYGIEYILAKDTLKTGDSVIKNEEEKSENQAIKSKEKEEIKPQIDVDVNKLLKDIRSNSITTKTEFGTTTVSNVAMLGKELALSIPNTHKINYIVLDEGRIKRPISNIVKLEKGNIIIVLTCKLVYNVVCVARYEITDIKAENHSIYLGSQKISDINQIDSLGFSDEVKREIRNYFMLVKKD